MKICIVTSSFPRGQKDGYANFVLQQAKSILMADGSHRVVVIAPHAPGLATRECIEGIEVIRFRYFFPASQQCLAYQHEGLFATLKRSKFAMIQLPMFLLSMLIMCLRYARGSDLVHAQWLPTCVVALPVSWILRIPLFVTARGADVNMVNSGLGKIILWCASRAKTVFVVSDEFRRVLARANGNMTIDTLYNGVHIPDLSGRSSGSLQHSAGTSAHEDPVRERVVLYVGGLIARKRVDTLIEAMATLIRKEQHDHVVLKVVGVGPEQSRIVRLIQSHDLAGRVQMLGALDNDEVLQEMQSSDLLVLPSESEGRPNVVLEAFACSLAVVASDIPGTSELIQSGRNGELHEPGNVADLAEKMNLILSDPGYRARIAQQGYETLADKGLTWSAHGRQLTTCYAKYVNS